MVREISASDPDLAFLQGRWAELPEHIKSVVMALVRSVQEEGAL